MIKSGFILFYAPMKTPRVINFPVSPLFRYNFRTVSVLSMLIVIAVLFVTSAGILYKDLFYPTNALADAFIPNDFANLSLGLPLLIFSIVLAQRVKLIGFLCLPGALFYMLYSYIPYLLSVPFSILFLPYIFIITLSASLIIYLVAGMNGAMIKEKLEGRVPVRLSGGILLGLAVLVIIRQVTLIIAVHIKQSPTDSQEIAVWITDLVIACPALIVVGLSLWKKNSLGYITGAALLLSYGILVLSLLIVMIYQACFTFSPVDSSGIAMLVIMACICLLPFFSFIKAAFIKSEN